LNPRPAIDGKTNLLKSPASQANAGRRKSVGAGQVEIRPTSWNLTGAYDMVYRKQGQPRMQTLGIA
jgi:hypothetical protein